MENIIDELFKKNIGESNTGPTKTNWNVERGWMEYQKQYGKNRQLKKRIFVYVSSIAAIFLMLFSLIVYRNYSDKKLITETNNSKEVKQLLLPDGNLLWLNKNSKVSYNSKVQDNYYINIEGEVFIDIKKVTQAPAIINAQNAKIIIEIPASLNIKAYSNDQHVQITVNSGSVKVTESGNENGIAILVTEGNYCSVHKSQKLVFTAENINNNYLAWKTGQLVFNNEPMASVADILSEYYGTKIIIDEKSIAYCLYSGSFESKSIDYVLNQIQNDLNVEIAHSDSSFVVSGKGCL